MDCIVDFWAPWRFPLSSVLLPLLRFFSSLAYSLEVGDDCSWHFFFANHLSKRLFEMDVLGEPLIISLLRPLRFWNMVEVIAMVVREAFSFIFGFLVCFVRTKKRGIGLFYLFHLLHVPPHWLWLYTFSFPFYFFPFSLDFSFSLLLWGAADAGC